MKRKLLILTAIDAEARAVARELGLRYKSPAAPVCGACGELVVELHCIGMAARHLPREMDLGSTCAVVMAGLAGALDPTLQVGDIVIEAAEWEPAADLPVRYGRIHTAKELLATPADKAAVYQETGALAVEMENAAVAPMAQAAGVPFVAIRAISDTAEETLDPAVLRFIDDLGRPRPGALAMGLMSNPWLVAHLRRLAANSTLATRNLGQCVRQVIERIEPAASPE